MKKNYIKIILGTLVTIVAIAIIFIIGNLLNCTIDSVYLTLITAVASFCGVFFSVFYTQRYSDKQNQRNINNSVIPIIHIAKINNSLFYENTFYDGSRKTTKPNPEFLLDFSIHIADRGNIKYGEIMQIKLEHVSKDGVIIWKRKDYNVVAGILICDSNIFYVKNIGKGPALNVRYKFEKYDENAKSLDKDMNETCQDMEINSNKMLFIYWNSNTDNPINSPDKSILYKDTKYMLTIAYGDIYGNTYITYYVFKFLTHDLEIISQSDAMIENKV